MAFKIFKEVSALPPLGSLEPDAAYMVRVGTGFDFYVTNVDGVPFSVNTPAEVEQRLSALEAALPEPAVLPFTLPNPFVSARLGPLYSQSARPFLNHFKMATPWQGDANNASWDTLVSGGYMTAGGQLISVQPGSNGFNTRLFDRAPAESGLSGRWRVRWLGTATWDVYGASAVDTSVPNEITFDFTADGNSWVNLVNRTIDPAGGQVREISVVHEDDWEAFDAGGIFRDAFLEEIRNYRVLRFDEWIGILRSTAEGGLRITTWASRGLPTDEIFYRFVPYEWMAALCNEVGADMWVCLPTASTEDHQEQAATLIRSLMPDPREVYAELSTKTWDFAGTPQAHYFADNGRIAFGTEEDPTQAEYMNYYALCATRMAQIWRGVWGADPRLHTVIQHQADVVGAEVDILVAPMWQERNGTLGLPPYVAPHTVIDMFTVHAQIDGGLAYHSNDALIDTWRTTLSQSAAFDMLRDQLLDARHYVDPEWVSSNRNVANMTTKWQHYKDVCDGYGMEFGIYEVGNHLNSVGSNADAQAFIQAFTVSPQMGEVYTAIFDALDTIGLDGPLCMSVADRWPDANTSHGLQRWVGDRNPAWQAVNTLNQTREGPAGRGAMDFVGTYELTGAGPVVTPPYDDTDVLARLDELEAATYKTVNGMTITGTGNILTSISFATDAEAAAFSAANPGVLVLSTQVS